MIKGFRVWNSEDGKYENSVDNFFWINQFGELVMLWGDNTFHSANKPIMKKYEAEFYIGWNYYYQCDLILCELYAEPLIVTGEIVWSDEGLFWGLKILDGIMKNKIVEFASVINPKVIGTIHGH